VFKKKQTVCLREQIVISGNLLIQLCLNLKNMPDTTAQYKNFVNRYLLKALNLFAILETENYVQYYETD
jgi:hypothetical protein